MATTEEILGILRKFRVLTHYIASRDTGMTRYAVFGPDGQVTEPSSHRDAQAARDLIIAQEILDLFTGDQP